MLPGGWSTIADADLEGRDIYYVGKACPSHQLQRAKSDARFLVVEKNQ
jgi:hypothetical protein